MHLRSNHLKHKAFIGAVPVCSVYRTLLNFCNQVFDELCLITSVDV